MDLGMLIRHVASNFSKFTIFNTYFEKNYKEVARIVESATKYPPIVNICHICFINFSIYKILTSIII